MVNLKLPDQPYDSHSKGAVSIRCVPAANGMVMIIGPNGEQFPCRSADDFRSSILSLMQASAPRAVASQNFPKPPQRVRRVQEQSIVVDAEFVERDQGNAKAPPKGEPSRKKAPPGTPEQTDYDEPHGFNLTDRLIVEGASWGLDQARKASSGTYRGFVKMMGKNKKKR